MALYNQDELNSMGKAFQRVMEAQNNSQRMVSSSNSNNQHNSASSEQNRQTPPASVNFNRPQNNSGADNNPFAALFGGGNFRQNSRQNSDEQHINNQHNNEQHMNQHNGGNRSPNNFPAPEHHEHHEHQKKPSAFGFLDDILPGINIDSEKVIIIALIILLAREGADLKLLVALGYLLM